MAVRLSPQTGYWVLGRHPPKTLLQPTGDFRCFKCPSWEIMFKVRTCTVKENSINMSFEDLTMQ